MYYYLLMKIRQPVPYNKSFSDILIRMYSRKVFALEFHKEFVIDILSNEKPYKTQSTLSRQLIILEGKGYLKKEVELNKKNRKLYFIVWEKIIEDFLNHCIKNILVLMEKHNLNVDSKLIKKKILFLKNASNRGKAKQNKYLQELFKTCFRELRQGHNSHRVLIADIFDFMLQNDIINTVIPTNFWEKISSESDRKDFRKRMKLDEDYQFFEEFGAVVSVIDNWFMVALFEDAVPSRFKFLLHKN